MRGMPSATRLPANAARKSAIAPSCIHGDSYQASGASAMLWRSWCGAGRGQSTSQAVDPGGHQVRIAGGQRAALSEAAGVAARIEALVGGDVQAVPGVGEEADGVVGVGAVRPAVPPSR